MVLDYYNIASGTAAQPSGAIALGLVLGTSQEDQKHGGHELESE
jgi:hypothetical protein